MERKLMEHPWKDPEIELPTKRGWAICIAKTFHGRVHIDSFICFENGRFFNLDKKDVIKWCYQEELMEQAGVKK